ncbi:tetrathionate reductase subunit C [Desulfitobacterium sp. LBE]|uniref:Molybdopterin oxidoreductase, chain C n=2 Tax=root TaxID=1 RepID=A0A098B9J9_DESHA|nr:MULTISPECIES: NrfD/PsrC family molybdoenzyme membrane anchor subunit [Desulfitobacterium]MEA5021988.1 NrfD/PsrC family molybdoenzyme membrane anchor subunit [Desulfitobacterium hafniense]TWH59194.1 tetrathionate reductase subunit C [Desulfitobacterium sp. LBE]CDX05045.1 Molybdopterin oxidoreductase, chain C [Desulfitobacterium hafniense]
MEITYLANVEHPVQLGYLISIYFFYTGLSAGSFVLSSLGTVFGIQKYKPIAKAGVVMAIALLAVAPLHLIADLEQPARFYTLFFRLNPTSAISYGTFLLTLYPLTCIFYLWFMMRKDFALGAQKLTGFRQALYSFLTFGKKDLSPDALARDQKWIKGLGTLGVPLALSVHGYTGFILANMQARALWHTGLMPLIFLMSAMVSGTGLLILILILTQRYFSPERALTPRRKAVLQDIARLMMWFIVVDGVLMAINFIILYFGNAAGYAAAEMLLRGSHSTMFLGVEIGLGLVIPFVITFWSKTRKSLGLISLASLLTLLGVIAMRINFVVGGQQIPLSGNALNPYHVEPRHLMFLGCFAVLEVVILYLAFKFLPVYGIEPEKERTSVEHHLPPSSGVSVRSN